MLPFFRSCAHFIISKEMTSGNRWKNYYFVNFPLVWKQRVNPLKFQPIVSICCPFVVCLKHNLFKIITVKSDVSVVIVCLMAGDTSTCPHSLVEPLDSFPYPTWKRQSRAIYSYSFDFLRKDSHDNKSPCLNLVWYPKGSTEFWRSCWCYLMAAVRWRVLAEWKSESSVANRVGPLWWQLFEDEFSFCAHFLPRRGECMSWL